MTCADIFFLPHKRIKKRQDSTECAKTTKTHPFNGGKVLNYSGAGPLKKL